MGDHSDFAGRCVCRLGYTVASFSHACSMYQVAGRRPNFYRRGLPSSSVIGHKRHFTNLARDCSGIQERHNVERVRVLFQIQKVKFLNFSGQHASASQRV